MKYQVNKTDDVTISYSFSGFNNFRLEQWKMTRVGVANIFHAIRIWKFRFMFSFINNVNH